jgi:hypothetical protein
MLSSLREEGKWYHGLASDLDTRKKVVGITVSNAKI